MIFKEVFAFGNKELEIFTLKELPKKVKSSIAFLINTFSEELNHNVTNSSAWKFNNGQTSISIYVKPEFIQYFDYVYELFNKYPDTFNPFSLQAFTPGVVSMDLGSKVIVKNVDFKFDTSYFRNTFILEYLSQYLVEGKFKEFLITYESDFIASGHKGWLIEKEGLQYNLINKSAIFFYYDPSGFKSHKFGALKNEIEPAYAFVIAKDLAKLKILAPQIGYVNTRTDLVKFCEENDIGVIFADDKF